MNNRVGKQTIAILGEYGLVARKGLWFTGSLTPFVRFDVISNRPCKVVAIWWSFIAAKLPLFWTCGTLLLISLRLLTDLMLYDIFPDEGRIAETWEFYLQLSAFNLPPSHL